MQHIPLILAEALCLPIVVSFWMAHDHALQVERDHLVTWHARMAAGWIILRVKLLAVQCALLLIWWLLA